MVCSYNVASTTARVKNLLNEMDGLGPDERVRLPGARCHEVAAKARAEGIDIPDALASELRQLARSKK